MTRIKFFSHSSDLIGFEVSGHTGFGLSGEDILCAAVSSATIMTANTITDILQIDAKIKTEDGFLKVEIAPHSAKACQPILMGLKLHLTQLEEQYQKNLKIITTEV